MNNGENRTKQIVTVVSRMTGRLNLTKNSKKAALERKAEEQRKAQKEAEIKYNEETSERIAGKGSERTQEELAERAWGSRNWKEMRYRERMAELYSKYTGIEYANSRRLTETYMDDTIESMLNEYSEKLEKEQEKLVEVKVRENAIQEENIETQTAQTESQIKQILAVAESEWEKAEKTLSAAYRKWKERFLEEVKGKREKWEKNYVEFLSEKIKWINRQYMNAAVGGNMELLKNSGTDIEKVLSNAEAALEAEEKEKNSSGKTEALVKETIDGLFEGEILSKLEGMAETMVITARNTGKKGSKRKQMNLAGAESYINAIRMQERMEAEIKTEAAKLAAEQAETATAQMIKSYMGRIEAENENIRAWQEETVRNDGYEYGETIEREVIVDASYANAKTKTQRVHKYEKFRAAAPEVEVDFGGAESESSVMRKIREAQEKLAGWEEEIFGKAEEAAAEKDKEGKPEEYTRGGEFGRHIGYGPEFKTEDLDYTKDAESNIVSEGSGEMGKIMLDFTWNAMQFQYGQSQLALPVYEKKLWLSDTFMEAPTIKSVASLVCDIAGTATGQSWWLGLVDDALFSALDITMEGKDAGEVAVNFGKAAAANTVSYGMGAASKGLTGLANNIGNTAGRTAVKATVSVGTAYTASAANSYMTSLTYSADGGWSMDWDSANSSWHSKSAIAGALGAGLSTGVTQGLNEYNLGSNHIKVNGLNSSQISSIQSLNSLAGGLSSSAVSFALTGNATFNLLNIKGSGAFELTLGKDGMSGRLGTGGTDISASNLVSSITGINSLHKNSQINKTSYDKTTKDALRAQWGFGDKAAKEQLEDIIKGGTVLSFDATGTETAQSITENGQKVIHINPSLNNGFMETGLALQHEAYRDGLVTDSQSQLSETANAVAGHTQMALAMLGDGLYANEMLSHIYSDTNLQNDMNAYLYAAQTGNSGVFANYVDANYDSSADFWKLLDDGSIAYDGKANLYDENGNLIYKTDNQGIQGSLTEILGLENQTEAYYLMRQAGMKWDGKSWINPENSIDGSLSIKMDMTTGKNGTGKTYKEIYETRELTDSLTGYTATLEQHNPKNIYQNMVANGIMDIKDEYKGTWGSIKGYFAGNNKYISYEDFKANNFITGGMPEYGINETFLDKEVSTLLGATGNISSNPHRGIDSNTLSTDIFPLIFNNTSYISNIGNNKDSIQGLHVDVTTKLNYLYKGQNYNDKIFYRILHLSKINVKREQNILGNTILGKTGNTGKWNDIRYGYHAHEDISTSNTSPYLDYLTNNTENVSNRIYYNDRYYYDKFLFVDKSKYNINSTANTYNW